MSTLFPFTHYFTFLRHAKSEANEQKVLQGQMNSPLTIEGVQQSEALGKYWSSEGVTFQQIISSPLIRARETADIISNLLSIPIEFDDKWMEREFGQAEGLPYEEVLSKLKDLPPRSIYEPAYETGESDWDLYIRAASAVQSLTYQQPGNYLVVSHGSIMNFALSAILGITPRSSHQRIRFRFNNTGYAQLEYNMHDQNWSLQSLNNTYHLSLLKTKNHSNI
jgi:2,3-bisphosphoglycerate-dependent phosphoglycerate mutase